MVSEKLIRMPMVLSTPGPATGTGIPKFDDELALRINVYPGVVAKGPWSPGLYLGLTDDGDPALGISLQAYPFGVGNTGR